MSEREHTGASPARLLDPCWGLPPCRDLISPPVPVAQGLVVRGLWGFGPSSVVCVVT